jgi:membrane-bound lytic murein transglycosylase D
VPDSIADLESEIAMERRLAADSAADAEILEQLATARPEGGDSNGHVAATTPLTGGANAVTAPTAVTWDIDVSTYGSHDRVQYYLDFFQTTARERMAIWLTRLPRYEAMIRSELHQRGVPEDMVYLALIESGFSNTAVSRSRAVGMWQFMKGTAKLYGLRVDSWMDERRDPIKATAAAARHLSDLRERFGSLYLAAAAYNAGAGKVGRGLARLPDEEEDSTNADASFFRLYDTKFLRRETKDYVPKLIAAALIAKEPERYGFPKPAADDVTPLDSIVVPDATGLDVIARLADTSVTAIRELNPQFIRLMTPPGMHAVVRLPPGAGASVATRYAVLPAKQRVTYHEHVVARGESVGRIAKRYGVSVQFIADANPGTRVKALRTGQRLIIPTSGVMPSRAVLRSVEDVRPRRRLASGGGAVHRVRAGESLSSIATGYHVSVVQLQDWNGLGEGSVLRTGQRLRVGARSKPAPARHSSSAARTPTATHPTAHASAPSQANANATVHVVRRGETLTGVAKKYGVGVTRLRQANGLQANSVLKAGAALKIPG